MAARRGALVTPDLEAASILVQTAETERRIAVYTYDRPSHPEGFDTFTVLQVDEGVITDAHGYRLSA